MIDCCNICRCVRYIVILLLYTFRCVYTYNHHYIISELNQPVNDSNDVQIKGSNARASFVSYELRGCELINERRRPGGSINEYLRNKLLGV